MIFRRWGAYIVDLFIVTIPFDIYFQLFKHRKADGDYAVGGAGALLVIAVPMFLYYVYMEHRYGQTLGKKLVTLKVIKSDGSPITYSDAIKRHILDFVELLIFPFIGILCSIINRKGQRIGDLLAGTQVVDAQPKTLSQ